MATISLSLQKSTSGFSFSDARQSHLYNNYIYTIDSNGKCYKSDIYGNVSLFFDTGGAGWFNLAIDANGNFYVSKNGTGILKYNSSGTLVGTFISNTGDLKVGCVDDVLGILYCYSYSSNSGAIYKYNLLNGSFIETFITTATYGIDSITCDKYTSNLLVSGNGSGFSGLRVYDSSGSLVDFNLIGTGATRQCVVINSNLIVVRDDSSNAFRTYDMSGNYIDTIGSSSTAYNGCLYINGKWNGIVITSGTTFNLYNNGIDLASNASFLLSMV